MEQAYLAHAVNGFFATAGTLCWVVRVGHTNGNGAAQGRAPLPAASNPKETALLATAKPGVEDYAKVEVTVEPPQPKAQRNSDGDDEKESGKNGAGGNGKTYTVTITAGRQHEEFNHVVASGIATLDSQLVEFKLGTENQELEPSPGTYFLSAQPPVAVTDVTTLDLEGNVTRREGLGSLAAIEDISMVCVPTSCRSPSMTAPHYGMPRAR